MNFHVDGLQRVLLRLPNLFGHVRPLLPDGILYSPYYSRNLIQSGIEAYAIKSYQRQLLRQG